MRFSDKPKLLQKQVVGAVFNRELKRSRLQAVPIKTNALVLSMYPDFHIYPTDNKQQTTYNQQLTTSTKHFGLFKEECYIL